MFDRPPALGATRGDDVAEFYVSVERVQNPTAQARCSRSLNIRCGSSLLPWSTMPDEALFTAGKEGTLRPTAIPIARMLKDTSPSLTKIHGSVGSSSRLHEATNAAPAILRRCCGRPTFFTHRQHHRSIMDFLEADYTFVDERRAKLMASWSDGRRIPSGAGRLSAARRNFHPRRFLTLTSKTLGRTRRTSPCCVARDHGETASPDDPAAAADVRRSTSIRTKSEGTVARFSSKHRVVPSSRDACAPDTYGFRGELRRIRCMARPGNRVDVDC